MIHVVNLCNSLAEWKHAMIVSHYINIILILISCLILSLNLVTQMWKIILKYPGTFQYTFCRAHYETSKNWRNFITSNCPGGCHHTDHTDHTAIILTSYRHKFFNRLNLRDDGDNMLHKKYTRLWYFGRNLRNIRCTYMMLEHTLFSGLCMPITTRDYTPPDKSIQRQHYRHAEHCIKWPILLFFRHEISKYITNDWINGSINR